MWDDRFIFVLSALVGISLGVVISNRRDATGKRRPRWFIYGLLTLIAAAVGLILAIRYFGHVTEPGLRYPSQGLVLAILIGGVVGSFSARFVGSLFSTDFGPRDPLIGVLVLLLLVIVYSLPVYQREISALLGHIGLSSLKTPIGELTFAEHSRFQQTVVSAAKPSGEERSSALPRPSDPRPGLESLRHAVSDEGPNGYLFKDAGYIAFFDGPDRSGELIDATKAFLRPVQTLARCLRAYVDIIPDSQLLLVDVKPVLYFFFRMHANAVAALRKNSDRPRDPATEVEVEKLYARVAKVREQLLNAIEATATDYSAGAYQATLDEADGDRNFVEQCRKDNLTPSSNDSGALQHFSYLQPYVTIALANLLVAHGSADEAIDVITQWLYLWSCARGEGAAKCDKIPRLPEANQLPEWFGIRAEFELNVLLYGQVGEANITYHDFLKDHAKHFTDYAAHRPSYDRPGGAPTAAQGSGGISIHDELQRCQDRKPLTNAGVTKDQELRAIILRSLLQNENTLLRSELHFLSGSSWTELENLHERGLVLTQFSVGCVNPEGSDEKVWEAQLANYKITSGLLALAIADRLGTTAASVDERNRAEEIKNEGKQQLRAGYRHLKGVRDDYRKKLERLPWSVRVFNVSPWEESCSLAERAIHQLNEASP